MRRLSSDSCRVLIFFALFVSLFWITEVKATEQKSGNLPMDNEKSALVMIDSEASPPLSHEVTPRFSWGAKLNFEERVRDNRDLDDEDDDRDVQTRGSLSVAGLLLSEPGILKPKFEIFGEVRVEREVEHEEGEGKTQDETAFDFNKGYLVWWNFISPTLHLQIGRQRFKDAREWIFDETLDAVRLYFNKDALHLQLSYSTNLFDPEDSEDKIKNLIWHGTYKVWKRDKAAAYIINRRGDNPDNDPTDIDLTFIGVSWEGKSLKKQKYWLDAAIVSGDEAGKNVRGYGFDVGWTSRFKYRFKPAFTIGYAFGSGDSNPDDNQDKSFRQTGLQDNSAKLRGVIRVEQYGEIFEPELSNLMITTFAFGIRPLQTASIDLVYHHFQQVWVLQGRDNELRDVGIKPDPNGVSGDLGDEVNLIFGWKVSKDLRLVAITGIFLPGSAFPGTDNAYLGKIKMEFLL